MDAVKRFTILAHTTLHRLVLQSLEFLMFCALLCTLDVCKLESFTCAVMATA